MEVRRLAPVLLVLGLVAAGPAPTPLNVKPGLWETTVRSESRGTPSIPREVLNQMPPETRSQVEAMHRSGAAGNLLPPPQTEVERSCVTAADRHPFLPVDNAVCTIRVITSTASVLQTEAQCRSEVGVESRVSSRIEALSPDRVTGTNTMRSGDGQGMTLTTRLEARWISADCGEVRPVNAGRSP
ncbi:MAG: DUF3617 domain-containing protein [Phenylobacterium sp.]